MPRESFVWVSAFPAPWHGRFGGGGGSAWEGQCVLASWQEGL